MRDPLSPKQQKVLDTLKAYILAAGQSPTLEELRATLGFSSLRTVVQYLDVLERKGYILRRKNSARNIELRGDIYGSGATNLTIAIPVVANVGCDDLSVFANEGEHDEFIEVDKEIVDSADGDIVAVRAVGSSMVDAGINDGDYILVQFTEKFSNGDRVAAIVNDMVVVKRLEKRDGMVILHPESKDPKYKPIILGRNSKLTGRVLCIVPRLSVDMTEIVPLERL